MYLIAAVEPFENRVLGNKLHYMFCLIFACMMLRKCVNLFNRIEIKDEDLVDQHACRVYFTLNCLFFAHHPTAWTLGLVVSFHAN